MSIFRLEAVVDILTGKAVKQLDDLDARAKKSASQMENLQKRIDQAGYAAQQQAKRAEELKKKIEAGGAGAEKAAKQLERLEKSMALSAQRTDRLKAELTSLQKSSIAAAGGFDKFAQSAIRLAGPAVLGALSLVLVKLGSEFLKFSVQAHDAMKRFQSLTGSNAAETQRFGQALQQLYSQNTNSIDDLAGGLQVVRREFGDLGDQVEPVTQTFLDFAKVTGTETKEAVDNVKDVLDAYGLTVADVGGVTDRLARINHDTGISIAQLTSALAEGAPVAAALGASMDDYLALLASFKDVGVEPEVATKALVKVLQAAQDGGEKNAKAFKELGLEVNALGRPVGGASAAVKAFMERMSDGKDAAGDFKAALQLLGPRLASDAVNGFHLAADGVQAWNDKLAESQGVVAASSRAFDEQFGEKAELIFRKHFALTGEMGQNWSMVIDGVLDGVEWLLTAIEDLGTMLGNMVNSVGASIAKVTDGLGQMWVGLVKLVKHNIAIMLEDLLAAVDSLPQALQDRLGNVREGLDSTAKRFRSESRGDSQLFFQGLASVKEGVKDFLPNIPKGTGNVFTDIKNVLGSVLTGNAFNPGQIGKTQEVLVTDEQRKAKAASEDRLHNGKVGNTKGGAGAVDDEVAVKQLEFALAKKKAMLDLSARDEIKLLKEIHDKHDLSIQEQQQKELQVAALRKQIHEAERQAQLEIRKINASVTESKLLDLKEEERRLKKAGLTELEVAQVVNAKKAEILRQQAQKAAEVEAQITGLTKSRLAGQLAGLDAEKQAALHNADDKLQVERLYAAKRDELLRQEAQRSAQTEAEITGLTKSRYEGELAALDAQKQAALHDADDKVQVERLFAARRAEIERQELAATQSFHAEVLRLSHLETQAKLLELQVQKADLLKQGRDRVDVERWVQAQVQQLRVDQYQKDRQTENKTLDLKGHTRELSVRGLEDEVRQMRENQVSEVKIQEYLTEQRKRFLREEGDEAKRTREEHEKLNAERNKGNSFGVAEAFGGDSAFNWIQGFSEGGSSSTSLLSKSPALFERDLTVSEGLQKIDALRSSGNTTQQAAAQTVLPGAPGGGVYETAADAAARRAANPRSADYDPLAGGVASAAAAGNAALGAALVVGQQQGAAAPAAEGQGAGGANKGASFGAAHESLLQTRQEERQAQAKQQASAPALQVSGEVKVTGTLDTPDGPADVHGTLDMSSMDARLQGDNPSLPGT